MNESEKDCLVPNRENKTKLEELYQDNILIGYKENISFSNGCYHEIIYDTKKQKLSYKKYSPTGQLISGELYENNKITQYIETDVDSNGIYHEILLDDKYMPLSHTKFDVIGRIIGISLYKGRNVCGYKEFKYNSDGTVTETVYDSNYNLLLEKIISKDKLPDTKNPDIKSVLIEMRQTIIDKDGNTHEILYNKDNHFVYEKVTPQNKKPKPQNTALSQQKHIVTPPISVLVKLKTLLKNLIVNEK